MFTQLFRRATLGAIGAAALFSGSAFGLTLTITGSALADGDGTSSNGYTYYEFLDGNPAATIASIESITLTGLTHSFASDLYAGLVYFPDDVNQPGVFATLFDSINDGSHYYSNNFNGNYTFTDEAAASNTLQNSVGADSTDVDIASGTFRPSKIYLQGQSSVIVNLDTTLAGLNLQTGSLYMFFQDYEAGGVGSLTGATVVLTTAQTPEPASIGALSLGAITFLRRRRA